MRRNFVTGLSFLCAFMVFFLVPVTVFAETPGISLVDEKPALKMGMRGERVENLQLRLKETGYYREAVDGIFGSATFNAVYIFQLSNDLQADGIAGSRTLAKLSLPLEQIKAPLTTEVSRGASRGGMGLVQMAANFMGTSYVWGGSRPGGFDCSGFIYYLLSQYGISSPRMADGQFTIGLAVEKSQLQAGDLVFFSTYEPGPSHVGIYMGDGNFIHASSAAGCVTVTPLNKAYYVERYLGARRLPI